MTTLPVSKRLARTRMLLDDLISHVENERNRMKLVPSRELDTLAIFTTPAAIHPILPVEIIDNVCQKLTMRDITSIARANSALNAVATRRLYHTIQASLSPTNFLRCMQTLDRSTDLAILVRTFEVNFINHTPTKNFYFLLSRILRKMVYLTTLTLELPKRHSPTWVLPILQQARQTFHLRSFTTSMHCKRPLAIFLDSQSEITELSLRGINQDSPNSLFPFISSLFSFAAGHTDSPLQDAQSSSDSADPDAFVLLPTSLPKLSHFNAIHAGPNIIRDIIASRPVTHISIPLFPPHTMTTLSALSLTSKPLSRLSVMSFDPSALKFLFQELASRFPELEALHIVVLMAEVSGSLLLAWSAFLVRFKKLRYITFVAALGTEDGEEREEIDERKIATAWHSSCPTLKTIILPQGKIWFEGSDSNGAAVDGEGGWKCLDLDESPVRA